MRVADTVDDYGLWQSLKNGEQEALAKIYFTHFKNLYEYGLRIVSDKELVKDTIQDLFVKLWNNRANFDDITKIKPYILVAFRSALYNKLQQQNKRVSSHITIDDTFEMEFIYEPVYDETTAYSAQTEKLMAALNQLTPKQKEIIYLRYFQELDYEEIAGIMNASVKSVYKLKARGVEALRDILNVSNATLLLWLAAVR